MHTVSLDKRPSGKPTTATAQRPRSGLLGVMLFIVSESMFFLGLFLAWFYLRAMSTGGWPPPGVTPPPALPAYINTAIALLSSAAMALAERAIAHDRRRTLLIWISIAGALGVVFMAIQSVEFTILANLAQSSAYGSAFTFLLVFHVLRVFAGVALMGVVLVRTLLGHVSRRRRLLVQATAAYWYFITGVWLVIFIVLYLG